MPSYINVYNTSLEQFRTQFKSKGYRFLPRSLTKIPEEFEFALPQYAKNGLIAIQPGDDLAAKEKEGLMNYLGYLMEVRSYFIMWMDEKKRNGVTVDKPHRLAQIEQWIEEIKEKYSADDTFEPIKSFKDEALPLDAKQLFAGDMNQKTVEQIINESAKTPKKFTDVDITKELKN